MVQLLILIVVTSGISQYTYRRRLLLHHGFPGTPDDLECRCINDLPIHLLIILLLHEGVYSAPID